VTHTLRIGYFYPEHLNLYGDNGNVEILSYRARHRGFSVEVHNITTATDITLEQYDDLNIIFMGGGPDSGQKAMYDDLVNSKKAFIHQFIADGKVGLFVCGAYQLFGHYYKAADGSILQGIGVFDLYTEHFGSNKPRCIGNTYAKLTSSITDDPLFPKTELGTHIVGFENHGGRTYLGAGVAPFAQTIKGHGNNTEDKTEGALHNNAIGTYFHGPFLSRNPHVADYLIYKALRLTPYEVEQLPKIDDTLVIAAHTASKNLKQ
jgi:lipid II isoglutaminyl synthase (glutamine-hydrolysing)